MFKLCRVPAGVPRRRRWLRPAPAPPARVAPARVPTPRPVRSLGTSTNFAAGEKGEVTPDSDPSLQKMNHIP